MDHLWRPVLAQAAVKLQALGITRVPVGRSDVRLCDGPQLHESDGPRGALSDSTSASAMHMFCEGWLVERTRGGRSHDGKSHVLSVGRQNCACAAGRSGRRRFGMYYADTKTNVRRASLGAGLSRKAATSVEIHSARWLVVRAGKIEVS